MKDEDKGRQVPYHRSGGGMSVVGGGPARLGLVAIMALAATTGTTPAFTAATPLRDRPTRREIEEWNRKRGDDSVAIAAAKAKRERKNAKRLADAKKVGAGETATEGHNCEFTGP